MFDLWIHIEVLQCRRMKPNLGRIMLRATILVTVMELLQSCHRYIYTYDTYGCRSSTKLRDHMLVSIAE